MAKTKQLSVSCENRPGTLARLARVLGDAKVSILGFNCTTSGAEGAVQLVVDNVQKAKSALEREGFPFTEQDVLQVELRHAPGALGSYTSKLAAKNINITAGYTIASKGARKAGFVLTVADLGQAARIR